MADLVPRRLLGRWNLFKACGPSYGWGLLGFVKFRSFRRGLSFARDSGELLCAA